MLYPLSYEGGHRILAVGSRRGPLRGCSMGSVSLGFGGEVSRIISGMAKVTSTVGSLPHERTCEGRTDEAGEVVLIEVSG